MVLQLIAFLNFFNQITHQKAGLMVSGTIVF